ncbi:MAG TPA: SpoIID/LytB domain-containing protein [Blastocatellia bacterium]|nr:SpoIID/LytB domain-containing protein [Blastocatellia bacterium]
MPKLLAAVVLMLLAAPAVRAETVRINLFSLFKPQVIEARVLSADGAAIDLNRLAGSRQLAAGSRVRFELAGEQLHVTISDARGARQTFTAAEARLHATEAATFELALPGKLKRTVRGDLTVSAGDKSLRGALKIILTTEREAAVASVVAAETEARAPEALKALAVVVRTYMLSHPNRHAGEGFDFCDTTHCQFYRGESDLDAEAARPAVLSAVAATAGEHLSFAGKPVEAYFTASCGGQTATPQMVWGGVCDYPYKRQRCEWCRGSSHYRWTRQADARAVFNALAATLGASLSVRTELAVDADEAGFVRVVRVRDSGREWTLSADEFRRAVGRRLGWNKVLSGSFTVTRSGGQMIFRGRGFGSQVGLCLAGALAQALKGRRYDEILRFYFPQAQLSRRSQNE